MVRPARHFGLLLYTRPCSDIFVPWWIVTLVTQPLAHATPTRTSALHMTATTEYALTLMRYLTSVAFSCAAAAAHALMISPHLDVLARAARRTLEAAGVPGQVSGGSVLVARATR